MHLDRTADRKRIEDNIRQGAAGGLAARGSTSKTSKAAPVNRPQRLACVRNFDQVPSQVRWRVQGPQWQSWPLSSCSQARSDLRSVTQQG